MNIKTLRIWNVATVAVCFAAATTATKATITVDVVQVGNVGNADDSTGVGGVAYEYAIGKYEVTIGQYTSFLNAVAATDTYGLYHAAMGANLNIAGISRSGASGSLTYSVINNTANRPITFVSWFDAARFTNWLQNGQPVGAQGNGTTETGAYTLNGVTSGPAPTKNTGATWVIPSEDEWYKAAYYQPAAAGGDVDSYWLYPTMSNSKPGNTIGAGTNQANQRTDNLFYSVTQNANYDVSQNYLTDVGAFVSSSGYYGTYDQGGNVYEWNDNVFVGTDMVLRGGAWLETAQDLKSNVSLFLAPDTEYSFVGFRVASVPASVPEPSVAMLILFGGGAFLLVRNRKGSL